MRSSRIGTALSLLTLASSLAASPAAARTASTATPHGVVSTHNVKSRPVGPAAGWVMVIHGGGWQLVGRKVMASEASTVRYITRLGWATDNIDYRKGVLSLPDVLAAYDALRDQVGKKTPICLLGHSAGGNLALLAAEQRPSVSCVISGAGPTDLVHLADQHAYRPKGLLTSVVSPPWTFLTYVVPSFGTARSVLRQWSPIHHASRMHASVLLGASTHDPLVPQQQMAELQAAMRDGQAVGTIKTMLLAGTATPQGQTPNFPHASITKRSLARWQQNERRLLDRVARQR